MFHCQSPSHLAMLLSMRRDWAVLSRPWNRNKISFSISKQNIIFHSFIHEMWAWPQIIDSDRNLQNQFLLLQLKFPALQVKFHPGQLLLSFLHSLIIDPIITLILSPRPSPLASSSAPGPPPAPWSAPDPHWGHQSSGVQIQTESCH